MQVDSLDRPAILQLLNSKDEAIMERMISGETKEKFSILNPGKYKFRLIMDDNQNGKWDTGRYIKHIQPEEVLIYDKEITLKANWEMEEVWVIK